VRKVVIHTRKLGRTVDPMVVVLDLTANGIAKDPQAAAERPDHLQEVSSSNVSGRLPDW
jgi:hypothetical protein